MPRAPSPPERGPGMDDLRITHVGGPTALLEVAGWRILTDPTFDSPGRRYAFGWGTSSTKTAGPAVAADDLVVDEHTDKELHRRSDVLKETDGRERYPGCCSSEEQ